MQDTEVQNALPTDAEISWRRLPWVALLAAFTAAVADTLIYLAASALGLIPQSVLVPMPGGESPLTANMVVTTAAVGAIGAAIIFAGIGVFSRHPVRLFRIVSIVVLALSFATPLTISGAPTSMILSMETMHVVAWAAIVGLLTTLARQPRS